MSKAEGSLPSYEESVSSPQGSTSQNTHQGQRIIKQLTAVRSQHVKSAIEQVCPVVEENASRGIARTVIILLPSDVTSTTDEPSPFGRSNMEHIQPTGGYGHNRANVSGDQKRPQDLKVEMSFSTDEDVRQVQLEGGMNREFWTQAGVVDNFRVALQERLSSSPDLQTHPAPIIPPSNDFLQSKKSPNKSLFGRISNHIMKDVVRDDPLTAGQQSALQTKERIEVQVNVEEICLRTVTDFGLYDTINRQGVIVRVHVQL